MGEAPHGSRPRIIVGLGNPGPEYSGTRHNVGFRCADRLARGASITFSRRSRLAAIGEGTIAGRPAVLAKPRTYVNRTGTAVSYLLQRYGSLADDLVVVYDDMDLALGTMRLRRRGSAGGHNGLKSVITAIGTLEFDRLRIGIGRPAPGVDDVDHVLSAFGPDEREAVADVVVRAAEAVVYALEEGFDAAMNRFN